MTFNLKDHLFTIDVDNFESQVIEYSKKTPILIDFWAEWCPPCIVIAPILKDIVELYQGELALGKIEVDEDDNMKLAGRYQTRGFPSVLLISNGIELNRFTGAKSKSFIINFLDDNLKKVSI
ncbi:MAG: thioredoxin family protein [Gammaproteobacteria bacterium]